MKKLLLILPLLLRHPRHGATNSVDVGEMNKLLLQKVEELTLYVIDLQKQINELKSNR